MVSLDVFNADPFTTIQLTTAVERAPYLPQGVEALDLFDPKPIRTKVAMVEQRQGQLVVLPFSDRGAPRTSARRNSARRGISGCRISAWQTRSTRRKSPPSASSARKPS